MKRALLIALALNFSVLFIFSQDTLPRYWIKFSNKNNSIFTLDDPQLYISDRAIQRRLKQNIELDSLDLPVSQSYIQSVLSSGEITFWGASKWLNGIIVKTTDTIALDSIANYSFVDNLIQIKSSSQLKSRIDKFNNFKQGDQKLSVFNTPNYPFGVCYRQHNLHHADLVQQLGLTGNNVHIAILDAGFKDVDQTPALEHLFSENKILSTFDFVRKETSVFEDHYHGEAVLSIIAGYDPGYYVGSASGASFHLLISEDVFSETLVEEYYWVVAAEYADSAGVDVINTSLGYTVFDDSTTNHSYSEMDGNTTVAAKGLNIAASKGILCVTSAGNSGSNAWKYISTPADADFGLTVGAVDSNGLRAFFSSQGPSFDGDIKPNVMSVGWNTYYIPPGSAYASQGNGTSFSAPMITGMVAALWEAMPSLTNLELMHLVELYSNNYANPDSLIGYGIPDVFQLLLDNSNYGALVDFSEKIKNVFPNPFSDQVTVFYNCENSSQIDVSLISLTGEQLHQQFFSIEKGLNKLVVELNQVYSSGIYFLVIEDEVIKLIKSN